MRERMIEGMVAGVPDMPVPVHAGPWLWGRFCTGSAGPGRMPWWHNQWSAPGI